MHKDSLKDMISEIIERADEAKLDAQDNSVNFGRNLGFVEVLSMFKRYLISENPDAPAEYGIDFDAEKRFL